MESAEGTASSTTCGGASNSLGRGPGSGVRGGASFRFRVLRYGFAYLDISAFDELVRYSIILAPSFAASRLLHHEGHVTVEPFAGDLCRRNGSASADGRSTAGLSFSLCCSTPANLTTVSQSMLSGAPRSMSNLAHPCGCPHMRRALGAGLLLNPLCPRKSIEKARYFRSLDLTSKHRNEDMLLVSRSSLLNHAPACRVADRPAPPA